ncbi:hypothetical protein CL689_03345 [Candidatus Saccharibacteria bacterium]|nr:hypothetical protein [Candidatus Saccharibacteria bacterium]
MVESALRRVRRQTAKEWRDANGRKWPSIRYPVSKPIFANGMGGERRGPRAALERAPRGRSKHRRLDIVGSREPGRRSFSGASTTQRVAVTSRNTRKSLPERSFANWSVTSTNDECDPPWETLMA